MSVAEVRRSWPMTAAWMTCRAGSRPPGVMTHRPGSTGPCAIASASICWPPRSLSAPATPDPIQNALLAALTTASVRSVARSPSAISSVSGGRPNEIMSARRLPIARQNVIGQREERVALRAGRKRVERFLRALGEVDRAAVRVVDRRMFLETSEEIVPLLLGHAARRDDVAHDLPTGAAARVLLQVDERQRHLAFAQVAADRLPHRPGVAGEVEQVVDDLERHAEVDSVLAQRLRVLVRDRAEQAADLRATAEEIRRLPAHDVEVLILGDVGVAVLGELVELAFDHPQRDVAQQPDDLQLVVRQRQRHRLDVQVVAEKYGDVVAPARVHGEPAAAQVRVVDDVVVNERGGMDELDDGRVEDRAIALVASQTG